MNPAFIEFTGLVAACLTTAAFFPQAIKTIRDRKTDGLSVTMYLMLVTGVMMWFVYGVLIGSWPLIISNSIVILPQVAILVLLLKRVWNDRNGIADMPAITVQGDKGAVGA